MKNKKYQLPVLIVTVGFLYGAYLFYIFASEGVPKLEARMRAKEAMLNEKKIELRRLRTFSENIESVKLSLRQLNLQLEAALESMPRNYDLSGLLRKLSVIGFNSGIQLSAFRPSTAVVKEGDFYETSTVSFNLSGSFSQIMSFFDQVLHLKRIIRIEKVALRSNGQATGAGRSNAGIGSAAEVTAKLYRFVD